MVAFGFVVTHCDAWDCGDGFVVSGFILVPGFVVIAVSGFVVPRFAVLGFPMS